MLVGATHAAFEDRKVAFDGVGVHAVAAYSRLSDARFMGRKGSPNLSVEAALVGIEPAFLATLLDTRPATLILVVCITWKVRTLPPRSIRPSTARLLLVPALRFK